MTQLELQTDTGEALSRSCEKTAGPVSSFAKGMLKPHEYRRIRGLLAHVDGLIDTMVSRDRQIRTAYWALRDKGEKPEEAFYRLSEEFFLSEDTIQQIVYPRRRSEK